MARQAAARLRVGTPCSLRREAPERATLLETPGALYTEAIPSTGVCSTQVAERPSAPTYPWQRQRFWITDQLMPSADFVCRQRHVLLGTHMEFASPNHLWSAT